MAEKGVLATLDIDATLDQVRSGTLMKAIAEPLGVTKEAIRKRLMQHAFEPCEWFMRGLQHAGADCYFACCNEAGNIAERAWDTPLDCAPFSDRMAIIFPHCSYGVRLGYRGAGAAI